MPVTVDGNVIDGPVRTDTVIPASGLAAWMTVEIDRAVGAGVIDGRAVDRLRTPALVRLAALLVREQYGPGVDGAALIRQAREG